MYTVYRRNQFGQGWEETRYKQEALLLATYWEGKGFTVEVSGPSGETVYRTWHP